MSVQLSANEVQLLAAFISKSTITKTDWNEVAIASGCYSSGGSAYVTFNKLKKKWGIQPASGGISKSSPSKASPKKASPLKATGSPKKKVSGKKGMFTKKGVGKKNTKDKDSDDEVHSDDDDEDIKDGYDSANDLNIDGTPLKREGPADGPTTPQSMGMKAESLDGLHDVQDDSS